MYSLKNLGMCYRRVPCCLSGSCISVSKSRRLRKVFTAAWRESSYFWSLGQYHFYCWSRWSDPKWHSVSAFIHACCSSAWSRSEVSCKIPKPMMYYTPMHCTLHGKLIWKSAISFHTKNQSQWYFKTGIFCLTLRFGSPFDCMVQNIFIKI